MSKFHRQTATFLAAVGENIPALLGPDMQYWIEHPQELQSRLQQAFVINREEMRLQTIEPKAVLSRLNTLALPKRTGAFDPDAFFQTRQGLYVGDDFRSLIVSAAKPVVSMPMAEIAAFVVIKEEATNAAIRRELPGGHVFDDAGAFCVYLAGMIERQKGGINGDLLADGNANIFYVRGVSDKEFLVYVLWNTTGRWEVVADHLREGHWGDGRWVYSRSC